MTLIDLKQGTVDQKVFGSDLYTLEQANVFGHCWLFLGHESAVPNPGDYFTSFMGRDPVIVQRDQSGKLRVYLNKCRHRGVAVCVHDRGNRRAFTCAYHGWTYTDGALTAVPLNREAYLGELKMADLGLFEAPKVRSYGGLIFATWDSDAMSLDAYLGDFAWWLDTFFLREDIGGLAVVPGVHKYTLPMNWKFMSEQDQYHFISTHGSVIRALATSDDKRVAVSLGKATKKDAPSQFSAAMNYGTGVPHSAEEIKIGDEPLEADLVVARLLGPEAVEWVVERDRLLKEKLKAFPIKIYGFHAGKLFPNCQLAGGASAFYGKTLMVHHPLDANRTEEWMWCAVEKNAPECVRKHQRYVLTQRLGAAGMVSPDDHENFSRMIESHAANATPPRPYSYTMGLGHDADDHRPAAMKDGPAYPGRIFPQMTEATARDFYRYWDQLMETGAGR